MKSVVASRRRQRPQEVRPRQAPVRGHGRRRIHAGDARDRRQERRHEPVRARSLAADRFHGRKVAARRPQEEARGPAEEGPLRVPDVHDGRHGRRRERHSRSPSARKRAAARSSRRPSTNGSRRSRRPRTSISAKMTDLLTTLSNLRADKFADKPLATGETVEVTARFGDDGSTADRESHVPQVRHASCTRSCRVKPARRRADRRFRQGPRAIKELTGVK